MSFSVKIDQNYFFWSKLGVFGQNQENPVFSIKIDQTPFFRPKSITIFGQKPVFWPKSTQPRFSGQNWFKPDFWAEIYQNIFLVKTQCFSVKINQNHYFIFYQNHFCRSKPSFSGQNRPKPIFLVKTQFFSQNQPKPLFQPKSNKTSLFGKTPGFRSKSTRISFSGQKPSPLSSVLIPSID